MKRTWTIIGVADVARSYRWYQSLFGQAPGAPAHDYFGQIRDEDGTVLICLHRWGDHEHPSLHNPGHAELGNGLLLFFRVDDFDAALARARGLVDGLEEDPHLNPATGTREFALRDPDGFASRSARWTLMAGDGGNGRVGQDSRQGIPCPVRACSGREPRKTLIFLWERLQSRWWGMGEWHLL